MTGVEFWLSMVLIYLYGWGVVLISCLIDAYYGRWTVRRAFLAAFWPISPLMMLIRGA